MKVLILYSSKTGFSQRYAQWLGAALDCQAVPFKARKRVDMSGYEGIVLFGGLYAGQMSGLKWLKKQLPALAGKRIAAVAVGCAPMETPDLPESMEKLFGGNPEIKGFYCQGGLDYEHMGAVDRAMMAALRAALRRKKDAQAMLEGISHSFAGARRENLSEILDWARRG